MKKKTLRPHEQAILTQRGILVLAMLMMIVAVFVTNKKTGYFSDKMMTYRSLIKF